MFRSCSDGHDAAEVVRISATVNMYIQQPKPLDSSVRPAFRIVGALILVGVAILFALEAVQVFSYKGDIVSTCMTETSSRSRLLCEVGDAMLRIFPTSAQATVLGIAIGCFSAAQLLLAWLLIKPQIVRNVQRME
jgi:hypothetical protein